MEDELSFLDHLEELRWRVLRVVAAVVLLSIAAYPLTDDALIKIKEDVLAGYGGDVVITTPMEAVMVRLKLSVLLGAFITVPLAILEAVKFMAPGLYPKEKKWFTVTLAGSFLLFLAGTAFAYRILLPLMIRFLLSYATPIAQPMLILDKIITFIILLALGMGVIFQWPLVAGVLAALGVVNARALAAGRRHAIVAILLIAAVITDPTFVTQIIVAVPMMILYEVGIIAAKVVGKRG